MPTYSSCFLNRPRRVRQMTAGGVYIRLYTSPVVVYEDSEGNADAAGCVWCNDRRYILEATPRVVVCLSSAHF